MSKRLRGIFPVLQTPLDEAGDLDPASLEREVDFCVQCGAHGVVFPVLGGEFQFLSDRERQRLVEVVIQAADGRLPVVAGVAGNSAAIAREHAEHAGKAGADAVVALPPLVAPGTAEERVEYYRAIADAAGVPVFIQNSPPGMSPDFLVRLLTEIENVRYVKEEAHPSAHNVARVVEATGEHCWGVFGGALGRWMISEMRRGAVGFMPAAETTDVYVQIWDAFQAGDQAEARRIFNLLLPLINFNMLLGMRAVKETLVRRGVIRTAKMRQPGCAELDDEDRRELDELLEDLRPLFRV